MGRPATSSRTGWRSSRRSRPGREERAGGAGRRRRLGSSRHHGRAPPARLPRPRHRGRCLLPVTERLTDNTLILPLFHELTDADQLRVVDALRNPNGRGHAAGSTARGGQRSGPRGAGDQPASPGVGVLDDDPCLHGTDRRRGGARARALGARRSARLSSCGLGPRPSRSWRGSGRARRRRRPVRHLLATLGAARQYASSGRHDHPAGRCVSPPTRWSAATWWSCRTAPSPTTTSSTTSPPSPPGSRWAGRVRRRGGLPRNERIHPPALVVGAGATVGMGAAVVRDVPDGRHGPASRPESWGRAVRVPLVDLVAQNTETAAEVRRAGVAARLREGRLHRRHRRRRVRAGVRRGHRRRALHRGRERHRRTRACAPRGRRDRRRRGRPPRQHVHRDSRGRVPHRGCPGVRRRRRTSTSCSTRMRSRRSSPSRTQAVVPVHLFGQVAPVGAIRAALARAAIPHRGGRRAVAGSGERGTGRAAESRARLLDVLLPGQEPGCGGRRRSGDDGRPRGGRRHPQARAMAAPLLSARPRRYERSPRRDPGHRVPREAPTPRRVECSAQGGGRPLRSTAQGRARCASSDRAPRQRGRLAPLRRSGGAARACDGRTRRGGIGASIHYPTPVPFTETYACLGYRRGQFPVAEAPAERILSLPMFPHLTHERRERVVDRLRMAAVRNELTYPSSPS